MEDIETKRTNNIAIVPVVLLAIMLIVATVIYFVFVYEVKVQVIPHEYAIVLTDGEVKIYLCYRTSFKLDNISYVIDETDNIIVSIVQKKPPFYKGPYYGDSGNAFSNISISDISSGHNKIYVQGLNKEMLLAEFDSPVKGKTYIFSKNQYEISKKSFKQYNVQFSDEIFFNRYWIEHILD